jgi:hypothetical protein
MKRICNVYHPRNGRRGKFAAESAAMLLIMAILIFAQRTEPLLIVVDAAAWTTSRSTKVAALQSKLQSSTLLYYNFIPRGPSEFARDIMDKGFRFGKQLLPRIGFGHDDDDERYRDGARRPSPIERFDPFPNGFGWDDFERQQQVELAEEESLEPRWDEVRRMEDRLDDLEDRSWSFFPDEVGNGLLDEEGRSFFPALMDADGTEDFRDLGDDSRQHFPLPLGPGDLDDDLRFREFDEEGRPYFPLSPDMERGNWSFRELDERTRSFPPTALAPARVDRNNKNLEKILYQNQQWKQQRLQADPDCFERLGSGHAPTYLWIGTLVPSCKNRKRSSYSLSVMVEMVFLTFVSPTSIRWLRLC